ncbi:Crp/Fnr family transcriptional regulator [Roseicyclus sp.]
MLERLEETGLSEAMLPDRLHLPEEAQTQLCKLIHAHKRSYPAGTVLKLEGDDTGSVFLVLSGWLLASKTLADGQRQIVDIILSGGILEPTSATPGVSALEVETLTDMSVAAIPRSRWHDACDQFRDLAELDHQISDAAMSRMAERMTRLGKAAAETVITYALCELCLRSTAHGLVEGMTFHIPMTQQQLGDFCGLSAVHICRTLRRLERNEVLSVTDHMDIVVHDLDTMAAIAEIDIDTLRQEIIPVA